MKWCRMSRENENIKSICHICTNIEGDTFVGIRIEGEKIKICFPLGYRLAEENHMVRNDVFLLLRVLKKFLNPLGENDVSHNFLSKIETFPISAYQTILLNYLESGYFQEKEVNFKTANRGKINWSRTIKNQNPISVDERLIYFNFSTKEVNYSKDTIITLIHKYCVYMSIHYLGWMYNIPSKRHPNIKFDRQLFLSLLNEKRRTVFDDRSKQLLTAMIDIILSLNSDETPKQTLGFGTNRFEYVWEKIIDQMYGIKEKDTFFAKTVWNLNCGEGKKNAVLEPDTIMIFNEKTYVLDAKYYKYGVTKSPKDLPGTSSISKQITYGEYVKKISGIKSKVFNAFIMPYNKKMGMFTLDKKLICIGEAVSEWKDSISTYERVVGLLLDMKDAMEESLIVDASSIAQLADVIEKQLEE